MIYSNWKSWSTAWNTFWFSKQAPETLGLIRILAGSMLFYTHLVWATGGRGFFGPDGILPESYRRELNGAGDWAWSHFDWLPSEAWLPAAHIIALLVIASFTLGFRTRICGILSWLIVISYANRTNGAQFGLDQVNTFLALYLAIGNSGSAYSIDRWLQNRAKSKSGLADEESILTNIAIRLIQVHLCVVYLFAAIGKAQGTSWLNGEAILMALSSYEYQSLDMVWLVHHMWLVNLATLISFFWELGYAALIWPKLTRPIFLGIAIGVHLGIGLAMGMLTFGLIMIYANLAFIPPATIRSCANRWLPGAANG